MKINIITLAIAALIMCACSGTTSKNGHEADAITERLTAIYADAQTNTDVLTNDHKYMSHDYNDLQDAAIARAGENGDIIIDADHWVQGQDVDNPSMRVVEVIVTDDNHATARVIITNFARDTEVTLTLVHERGDWYIDNMQQMFEGTLIDEKQALKDYLGRQQ